MESVVRLKEPIGGNGRDIGDVVCRVDLCQALQHVDRPPSECSRPDEFEGFRTGYQGAVGGDLSNRVDRRLGQEGADRKESAALVREWPDPLGTDVRSELNSPLVNGAGAARRTPASDEARSAISADRLPSSGRTASAGKLSHELSGRGGIDGPSLVLVKDECGVPGSIQCQIPAQDDHAVLALAFGVLEPNGPDLRVEDRALVAEASPPARCPRRT